MPRIRQFNTVNEEFLFLYDDMLLSTISESFVLNLFTDNKTEMNFWHNVNISIIDNCVKILRYCLMFETTRQ
jgi:hypothetical protein